MTAITLNNVWKIYDGDVEAVRDVSFTIDPGEFMVLVGPSGCGKSTTLRMIAGLEDISRGTIQIGDRIVNGVHPRDRDIAMVFQNYALYPQMTVRQNMSFALKLRRTPRAEIARRVENAARVLDLTGDLDRKPSALSGGQRQRVAVGRAIVRDPSAFLFDEPLSNLDAKLRVSTRTELKQLHQRLRTTTVYVTHDQEEAMTLGDRVVVMADGVVQQIGTPIEVFKEPANRFVAGFVGTPPMNFVEGSVRAGPDGIEFEEAPTSSPVQAGKLGDPIRITLPHSDRFQGTISEGQVTLGLRPQGVRIHRANEYAESALSFLAEIELVEPLGAQMDVRVRTGGGSRATLRVAADLELGYAERVRIEIDPAMVHLFEVSERGRCLTSSGVRCSASI